MRTRFGLVVGPGGGVVAKMKLPYQLCLGAELGTGEQWISWISLHDLIHAMDHALHSEIEGAVNFVSPHPARQRDFSRELARALHRPAFLKFPAFLLKMIFGQAADEMLLSSARASAKKLIDSGFTFKYPTLDEALKKAVAR